MNHMYKKCHVVNVLHVKPGACHVVHVSHVQSMSCGKCITCTINDMWYMYHMYNYHGHTKTKTNIKGINQSHMVE